MPTLHDPEEIEIKFLHDIVDLADTRVLEIGCGDGRLTWYYADSAKDVVGVDPNAELLATALHERPSTLRTKVTFTQAIAEVLPFPRERFDLAIMSWSF
jgi:ubiquinone/menaquinone biosynthesis C-methylase UbiE